MNTKPAMDHSDEIQLLNLCVSGEREAFEELVKRYQNLICSMAYSALGNKDRSEDLAQETFVAAWVKLKTLRDRSKFKSWLCGIARNLIHQSIRKDGRNPISSAASLEVVGETAGSEPSPAEEAIRVEEESLVWLSLETIPETYREPLVLFYREGQSVQRVAEAMDLSPDAVKQRLSRGREMLRREVTSLVESALTRSKPVGTFTAGVLMALPLAVPKSAAAAGAGTVAKTSGSIFNGLSAIAFVKLMVVGWCAKVGFDSNRSPREKRIYMGVLLGLVATLTFYCITLFAPEWIGLDDFMAGSPSRPAALMAMVIFPFIAVLFLLGRYVERIRIEEGNWVEDQPVIGATADSLSRRGVIARFAGGTFGVAASQGAFSVLMSEWTDLAIILLAALLAGTIGTMACLRYPKKYSLVMGISAWVTGAVALLVAWSGLESLTTAAHSNWFLAALSGTTISIVIVSVLAWKRGDLMQWRVIDARSAPQP